MGHEQIRRRERRCEALLGLGAGYGAAGGKQKSVAWA